MSDRLVELSTNAWLVRAEATRASHSYTSTPGEGIRTKK